MPRLTPAIWRARSTDALPAAYRARDRRDVERGGGALARRAVRYHPRSGSFQRAAARRTGFGRNALDGAHEAAGGQEPGHALRELFGRGRVLAPHPAGRRPAAAAQRILYGLYAVSAGGLARHAAGDLGVPNPGERALRLAARERQPV